MIETIRKKINLEKCKSHVAGLLPYVVSNGGGRGLVSMNDTDGNWGNFPMDIAIAKEEVAVGDFMDLKYRKFRYNDGEEGSRHSTESNRLKYATIMMMYNEIQHILEKSAFTKAVRKYKDKNEVVECEEKEDCSYEIPERDKTYTIVLSESFRRIDEVKSNILTECNLEDIHYPKKYDFMPVPLDYFFSDGEGNYINRYDRGLEEDYDDDETFVNGENEGELRLEEGEYYVIMPDYETYRKYEDYWDEWWRNNGFDSNDYFPVEDGEFRFCKAVEKYIIGKEEVPQDIEGLRVPEYVYHTLLEKYKSWFEKNGLTNEEAVANAPKDVLAKFNDMGGLKFYNFLVGLSGSWITSIPSVEGGYGMTYVTPYISVPLSLEDNHEYGGIYENYEYSYSEVDDDFVPAYSDFDGYSDKEFDRWVEPDALYAESMLSYVIDDEATEVEGVTGTWSGFTSGGQICACTYSNENWTFSGADGNILCGDGEAPGPDEKYRSMTIMGVLDYAVPSPTEGGTYYFLFKKQNDIDHPFDVPYTEGSFHDMRETDEEGIFIGNYITKISVEDGIWTIQYVIGGLAEGEVNEEGELEFTPIDETGVKYEESYVYHQGDILKTFMDGVEGVRVYYNWIDTEAAKENVYSEEYRLYRKANKARIIGMRVGGMFSEENMMKAMVFTRDGSDSLPDMTKNEFDVIMDRGNAAAFERYFKLSECNTFEDLQNYGNNFYNL